jgi:acyl-[acyl-carrier-protein]-phospholipid O-acyltransferase/long-chain-fatty-acid--[acyl-carrier-protein] ligase
VGIAVVGTLTSLPIRRTGIAVPDLPLRASSFGVDRSTVEMLRQNRQVFVVLMISCLFWFLGSMVTSAVNAYGRLQLGLNDLYTSLLVAVLAVGIAIGCVLAGVLSKGRVSFGLVNRASWGMCGALALLCVVPHLGLATAPAGWLSGGLLLLLGVAAGLFAVPLQVYLQAKPPAEQKGRMIGTMNLFNWIAILIAAGAYGACSWIFTLAPESPDAAPRSIIAWTFALLAGMMLPVAIWFHPQDEALE